MAVAWVLLYILFMFRFFIILFCLFLTQGDRKRSSIYSFTPQMTPIAVVRSDQNQEPEIQSGSLLRETSTQIHS